MQDEKHLSTEQRAELLTALQARFARFTERHPGISWDAVLARLEAAPAKVWSLSAMEGTGGEPDVIGQDGITGEFLFCDCTPETPAGRRNCCYDDEGQVTRKKQGLDMAGSAVGLANAMGITLLTEDQYRTLQTLGEFDTKTSSWVLTPPDIRKRGGALFMDRRYGHVFVYHNSAPSFYAGRGFRGLLRV